jgi:septal ring factor EnvC (AmiA/AmiB activator)
LEFQSRELIIQFSFYFAERGVVVDSQTVTIIGLFCTIGGFVIAFLTFSRSRDKENKSDASELAVIRTRLTDISTGVSNIQIDIKSGEKRTNELSERLIRVEESSKQAHKRIDEIINKGEMKNE